MFDNIFLLTYKRCLLCYILSKHAKVAHELLEVAIVVADDLVRMVLAVEFLLPQHLHLLAHQVLFFYDVQILINLLRDESIVLVAYGALILLLPHVIRARLRILCEV